MKEEVHYGQYLVIMMDLLGQKEMYKNLESFSHSDIKQNPDFVKHLSNFIKSIDHFKRDIDSFMEGANSSKHKLSYPEHANEFVAKTKKELCKTQRFSDGIMVFVPLMDDGNSLPVSSVFSALSCAASTMIMSLARRNPIRVGIGIGGGAEIDEGELFGPAIGYAHEMESKRAIYPRIAIHEKVVEYLNVHSQLENSEYIEHKYSLNMAKLCRSMILRDGNGDGEYILDYLGEPAWDYFFKAGGSDLLTKAFDFVKEEKNRFEIAGNTKLKEKYSYLYNYFRNSFHPVLKDNTN